MRIIAGTLRTAQVTGPQFYTAVSATGHPNYNQFFSNSNDPQGLGNNADIGVVVVGRDITQVPVAPMLSTAQLDANVQNGSPLIITGYGVTQVNGFNNGTLFIAETPYVRRSASEFIAGGSGFPDTCQGDSGGPVYAFLNGQAFVIGATSRGIAGTSIQCGAGGIYSLAPAFISFLEQASNGAFTFQTPNLNGGGNVNPPDPVQGEDVCGMCSTSSDCEGNGAICLRYPEGAGFCSRSCSTQSDCPSNFDCVADQGFCVPQIENQCLQNDVFRVDACGTAVAQQEDCQNGCQNGTCSSGVLAGDTCESADRINAETQIIDGSLVGFNADTQGTCAGAGPERSFKFTLDSPKLFKAESSGFDTVLYLQRGCGQELLCNDDKSAQGADRGSIIEGFLEAGDYTLVIDAFDNNVADCARFGDCCEDRNDICQ